MRRRKGNGIGDCKGWDTGVNGVLLPSSLGSFYSRWLTWGVPWCYEDSLFLRKDVAFA